MTTEYDRIMAANRWNASWVDIMIQQLESTKSRFEGWETLGSEAMDIIDDFIKRLECIKTDYEIREN